MLCLSAPGHGDLLLFARQFEVCTSKQLTFPYSLQYSPERRRNSRDIDQYQIASDITVRRPAPGLICLQRPHRRPPNGKRLSNRESLRSQHLTEKHRYLSPALNPPPIFNWASPPAQCSSVLRPARLRLFGVKLSLLLPVVPSPPTPPLRTPRTSRRFVETPSGKLEFAPQGPEKRVLMLESRWDRRMTSPSPSASPMRASRPTSSTRLRTLWRPPRRS